MVRTLVFILKALGRRYSYKWIGLFLWNTDHRMDWTHSTFGENRKGSGGNPGMGLWELGLWWQLWWWRDMDRVGNESQQPFLIQWTWWEGRKRCQDGCQLSGSLIFGCRCYLLRGCWRRKDFEGKAMSSVLGTCRVWSTVRWPSWDAERVTGFMIGNSGGESSLEI